MLGSMHGPTLPGGRGGGRRRKKAPKVAPKLGPVKPLVAPPAVAIAKLLRDNSKQEHKQQLQSEAGYWERRNKQLVEQGVKAETDILCGCRVYFNGRTGGSTKLALTELVQRHGGSVTNGVSSRITHVIGTNTSATKAHQYLRKSRMSWKFVSPLWLTESIRLGNRQPEHHYAILQADNQPTVHEMLAPRHRGHGEAGSAGSRKDCARSAPGTGRKVHGAKKKRVQHPVDSSTAAASDYLSHKRRRLKRRLQQQQRHAHRREGAACAVLHKPLPDVVDLT